MKKNPISTLPELRTAIKAEGQERWESIAIATNVSRHTIRKMAYGDVENPTYKVFQALLDYFNQREAA